MSKKVLIAIIVIVVVLAVLVIGGALFFFKGLVSYGGTIHGEVAEPITIERDRNGVPAIRTKSPASAFTGIGFVHAQDRLAQIEYFRAIARGRLAELIGENAIVVDKLARTIGFHRSALDIMKRLKGPSRDYLTAYVKGINLFRKEKAHEFVGLLGALPEEWAEADVLAILLMFEWTDAYLNNREIIMPVADSEHKEALKDIIPPALQYFYNDDEKNNVLVLRGVRRALELLVDSAPGGFSFYLPGSLSKDGQGFLGFSLTGSIDLFPRHYPVVMETEKGTVSGVTMAGLPFVMIGSNVNLAFCGFSLHSDTQQLYLEKTQEVSGKTVYLSKGMLRDFESVTETIAVRKPGGRMDQIVFTVRKTERGPVVSDILRDSLKTDLVSVEALQPDESLVNALFEIPFADTALKARTLIIGVNANPRVYLFAGRDAVMQALTGRQPVMGPIKPGSIFFDGSAYLSRTLVDLSGFFRVVGNELVVMGGEIIDNEPPPVKDALVYRDGELQARVKEMLERETLVDERYCERLFADTYSPLAEKIVPIFNSILENMPITSAKLAKLYFSKWNFRADADSVPAALFEVLLPKMIAETVQDEAGDDFRDIVDHSRYLSESFLAMLNAEKSSLFDDITTEPEQEHRDSIFDRAFLKTLVIMNKARGPLMEEWQWGTLFRGEYGLPLNITIGPLSRRIFSFHRTPIAGDSSSLKHVGVSVIGKTIIPSTVTTIAGYAHGGSQALGTAYGNSINPFSEHYSLEPSLRRIEPFRGSEGNRVIQIVPGR